MSDNRIAHEVAFDHSQSKFHDLRGPLFNDPGGREMLKKNLFPPWGSLLKFIPSCVSGQEYKIDPVSLCVCLLASAFT